MDYDYEYEEPYEARILWGRIAAYGAAFVLVFLLGTAFGGRGGVPESQVTELRDQVSELAAENEQLEERISAMTAEDQDRPRVEPTATPTPTETAAADDGDTQGQRTYVVQPGDNLYGIAIEMYGDGSKFRRIAEANGIDSDDTLVVGQELVIPPDDE